jgi:hypothetical protein
MALMTQRSESDGSAGSPPPRRRRLRLRLKIGAILIALVMLGSFFDYLGRVRQAIFPGLRIPKSYLTSGQTKVAGGSTQW